MTCGNFNRNAFKGFCPSLAKVQIPISPNKTFKAEYFNVLQYDKFVVLRVL